MSNIRYPLHSVEFQVSTWNRDSHGLFDYETKNLAKKNFKATGPCWIIRTQDQITTETIEGEPKLPEENSKVLAMLTQIGSNFILNRPYQNHKESIQTFEKMWLVVSGIKGYKGQKGYKLSEGDIIRIGRVVLRINEINGSKESSENTQTELRCTQICNGGIGSRKRTVLTEEPLNVDVVSEGSSQCLNSLEEKAQCRICLMESASEEDPLITPCKCAGTMAQIHLNCLRHWLTSKVTTREISNSKSYSWKTLECELCKMKYPDKFIVKGVTHDLLGFEKPQSNYIVLENLNKDRSNLRTIHVIAMTNKNNIRLGRGHDADIRITDISVSRNHATIRLIKNNLVLEDNESKFGTLVQIKKPIFLDVGSSLTVQCGRSVMAISVKKSWSLLSCFGSCSKGEEAEIPEIEHEVRENTDESDPSDFSPE